MASAFKSDLIGMLSHDLRQPLGSVVGHVELLREDWAGIQEVDKRRFLDKAADAAARVHRLVEDLLTMTKGDAHKLEPDRRPIEVADAVAEAMAHVTPSAPIAVDVDPSLWIDADPGHLQQGPSVTTASSAPASGCTSSASSSRPGAASCATARGSRPAPPSWCTCRPPSPSRRPPGPGPGRHQRLRAAASRPLYRSMAAAPRS